MANGGVVELEEYISKLKLDNNGDESIVKVVYVPKNEFSNNIIDEEELEVNLDSKFSKSNNQIKLVKAFEVCKEVDCNITDSDGPMKEKVEVSDVNKVIETFSQNLHFDDQISQDAKSSGFSSRGPDGGKPVSRNDRSGEWGPPAKFVKSQPMPSIPDLNLHLTLDSMNFCNNFAQQAVNFQPPVSGYSYNKIIQQNFGGIELMPAVGTNFGSISSNMYSKTAGEVFGENNFEPTLFSLTNPNVVCDEYGQIITKNNQRALNQNQFIGNLWSCQQQKLQQEQSFIDNLRHTRQQPVSTLQQSYSPGQSRTQSNPMLQNVYLLQNEWLTRQSQIGGHQLQQQIATNHNQQLLNNFNIPTQQAALNTQQGSYAVANNLKLFPQNLCNNNNLTKLNIDFGKVDNIGLNIPNQTDEANGLIYKNVNGGKSFRDQSNNQLKITNCSIEGISPTTNIKNLLRGLPDQELLNLLEKYTSGSNQHKMNSIGQLPFLEPIIGVAAVSKQPVGRLVTCAVNAAPVINGVISGCPKPDQSQLLSNNCEESLNDLHDLNNIIGEDMLDMETMKELITDFLEGYDPNDLHSFEDSLKLDTNVAKSSRNFGKSVSSLDCLQYPPESLTSESYENGPLSIYASCGHTTNSADESIQSLENIIVHPDFMNSVLRDFGSQGTCLAKPDDLQSHFATGSRFFSDSATMLSELRNPLFDFEVRTNDPLCDVQPSNKMKFPLKNASSTDLGFVELTPLSSPVELFQHSVDTKNLDSAAKGNASIQIGGSSIIKFEDHEDLSQQDEDGDNLLHRAVIDGDLELLQAILVRLDSDKELKRKIIETKNDHSQTPLCLAVLMNQPTVVKSLVNAGADLGMPIVPKKSGARASSFSRPLHFAASKGQLWIDCLRELLASQDIEIDSLDSEGKTPLHCAIKGHGMSHNKRTINSIPSMEQLIGNGADLNKPDGCFDMTALHYAILAKSLDMVSCLLSLATTKCHNISSHKPQNENQKSPRSAGTLLKESNTPNHLGAVLSKMLNAKTGTGFSALHLAASLNMKPDTEHIKLIQLLLSKGADPSSKNSEGQLPRELTKNQKVVELLKGIGLGRRPTPQATCIHGSSNYLQSQNAAQLSYSSTLPLSFQSQTVPSSYSPPSLAQPQFISSNQAASQLHRLV